MPQQVVPDTPEPNIVIMNKTVEDGEVKETPLLVQFQPFGTKVCLRPITGEETTKAGIILPDVSGGEKPQEGEIIAIGDEVDTTKKRLKVGDRVLFSKYAGDEIRIRDMEGREVEFKVLHLESILGVVLYKHDEQKNPSKVEPEAVRPDETRSDGKSSGKKLRPKKKVS